jgi:hypothetical protein
VWFGMPVWLNGEAVKGKCCQTEEGHGDERGDFGIFGLGCVAVETQRLEMKLNLILSILFVGAFAPRTSTIFSSAGRLRHAHA